MSPPLKKPNFEFQFFANIREELFALRSFLKFHWVMVLVFLAGLVVFIYVVRPVPPSVVTIATGQPGSTYDSVGQMYQAYFRHHGIELKLVPTNGSVDNNRMVSDRQVDAAFSQSGVPIPKLEQVESLGSIEFEPLWFFYRGEPMDADDLPEFLARKRVSVGAEGSGTKYMVLELLNEHKINLDNSANQRVMTTIDSAQALRSGEIDGMFILADMASKQLWSLLEDPSLQILSFKSSHAISSKLGYTDPVVFPRGSVTLNPVHPANDIDLVATNTRIIVDKDMHPAIQYLFMMAGAYFYRNTDVYFKRPGGFPAFLDNDTEKSEVALKYLRTSSSFLERTFPFWIASFLDRAWLLVAALFAIAYPLFKMVPRYRNFHFNTAMNDCYIEMRQIEAHLDACQSEADLLMVEVAFERLDEHIKELWVPTNANERYYLMLNGLRLLRDRLDRHLQDQNGRHV
jgi:TRAP-type uncharacterized transport system substrate-binding protein